MIVYAKFRWKWIHEHFICSPLDASNLSSYLKYYASKINRLIILILQLLTPMVCNATIMVFYFKFMDFLYSFGFYCQDEFCVMCFIRLYTYTHTHIYISVSCVYSSMHMWALWVILFQADFHSYNCILAKLAFSRLSRYALIMLTWQSRARCLIGIG